MSEPTKMTMNMTEPVADGEYTNFTNIVHNPTEFFLDFARVVPGRASAHVVARVNMNPYHAKQLLAALQKNIALYENAYGEIRTTFEKKDETPSAAPTEAN